MAIYTKVGDQGMTRFPDGQMLSKTDPRVGALGAIDELNSHLGLCLQAARTAALEDVVQALEPLQGELMALGAKLVGAAPPQAPGDASVTRMERQIDAIWAKVGPLTHFVLPGGAEAACRLHVARTVCRRAERAFVAAAGEQAPAGALPLRYLNRLSDLLFTLARLANHLAGEKEILWP